nr:DNA polymerase [uncultured Cohaesibacter sp.]
MKTSTPKMEGTSKRRKRFVFDIETNGLLDQLDRVHCLVLYDLDAGELLSYRNDGHPDNLKRLREGVALLENAELIIGHNIINFDIPALKKVYPDFKTNAVVRDTLVLSRVLYPDIKDADFRFEEKRKKKGRDWIPKYLFGRHSLESWGYRLGEYKGDFKGPWDTWTQVMQDYCDQDVRVNTKIWNKFLKKLEEWGYSEDEVVLRDPAVKRDFIQLEHDVARIITRQEHYGFYFDQSKARTLHSVLLERLRELEGQLHKVFAPWLRNKGRITVKTDRKVKRTDLDIEVTVRRFSDKTGKELKPYVGPIRESYTAGSVYCKIAMEPFNPGSRQDIADRLIKLRGWKPKEYTADGHPKVSEDVLASLKFPEAKLLTEYLMVQKRLGQLSDGKQAWLKALKPDGRIHGRVTTNGAVTGRMTHSSPNVAQVPSGRAAFGHECRELFCVPEGKLQVGCDAEALELRDLAGYMARYDKGAYVKTVLEGKKEDATDIHSVNARALGCDRDTAKTWFYAFIYGGGDFKLGQILHPNCKAKRTLISAGKLSRAKFLKNLPALGKLTDLTKKKAKGQGWMVGLDGRRLFTRSEHSALNTLLQAAGAIQMKRALVILDSILGSEGLMPGEDYEFIANVHDEWQLEVTERAAKFVAKMAERAIRLAGEFYSFRCPLAGSADIGKNWNDCH